MDIIASERIRFQQHERKKHARRQESQIASFPQKQTGRGGIPLEILKLINLKQVPILSKQVNFFFYKSQVNLLTSSFFLIHFHYIYSMNTVRKGLQSPRILGAGLSAFLPICLQTQTPFHTLPPLTLPRLPPSTNLTSIIFSHKSS